MFNQNLLIKTNGQFVYNNYTIPERKSKKKKFLHDHIVDPKDEELFDEIRDRISDKPIDNLLKEELPLSDFNFEDATFEILGEYYIGKKEIIYYGKNQYQTIVSIHERFHAIHHLTCEPGTNKIWENFAEVDSYYIELLAQLFTYRYIIDSEPHLETEFLALNRIQGFKYQTWKFFRHFNTNHVVKLYWEIRKASLNPGNLKMFNSIPSLKDQLQVEIEEKLVESLTHISLNPLIFVSEADIQYLVMKHLMTIPKLNPDQNLYKTACTIGTKSNVPSKENYQTMLMHREYGVDNSPHSRYDIVILNPADVEKIDDPINLKHNEKWLTPDYIFEFGTEKSATGVDQFTTHLKNDLLKVAHAKKQGYLIHIQRNFQRNSGKRHDKNKAKFEDYIKKYEQAIINFLKTPITVLPKIIFIFIDIGGHDRTINGKVKIIKNPHRANCKLLSVNLKKIRTELEHLIF